MSECIIAENLSSNKSHNTSSITPSAVTSIDSQESLSDSHKTSISSPSSSTSLSSQGSSPSTSRSSSCSCRSPSKHHHHHHHHHHHNHNQDHNKAKSSNSNPSSNSNNQYQLHHNTHNKEIQLLQHQLRQQQALTAAARSQVDSLTRTAVRIHRGLIRQMDVQHGTYPTRIAVHKGPMTSLKFAQMLYAQVPVRLTAKDVFPDSLQALNLWTNPEYMHKALKGTKLTVAQTPSGLADAPGLRNTAFMQPHVAEMDATDFLKHLRNPDPPTTTTTHDGAQPTSVTESGTNNQAAIGTDAADNVVLYMQSQNDNYPREFPSLINDAPHSIPWANEALDVLGPAAVNLWLGDYRTTSRLHNDNYENLYIQVSGSKELYLIPPGDAYALDERFLKPLSYGEDMSLEENNESDSLMQIYTGQEAAGSETPKNCVDDHGDSSMNTPPRALPDEALTPSSTATASTVTNSGNPNNGNTNNTNGCGKSAFKTPHILFPTVDPSNPLTFNDIYSQNAFVYRVVLNPGDMLYIPALWYHQVRVLDGAPNVSLNYWYTPTPTNGQWMRWDYVRYCSAVLRRYHDPFYFDEEDEDEPDEPEDMELADEYDIEDDTDVGGEHSSLTEEEALLSAKRDKVQKLMRALRLQQQQYQDRLQKQQKLQRKQRQHLIRQQQRQHARAK
ncbi:uncharacterized protein SAPINGB_P003877 [Magnusiomyces paraingens]|uniref:JmjC domain-containing protein n=1 Tax=Magnusiomyces paraingens TaxID=2606893 RepID=A0A5E8BSP2_9ASCO|nr:uncharacterized protein SAPINGB_P003877 [Saprochaete ingens]VVT54041.1 unnamed protein product [Saprochaete ingens]